MRSVGLLYRGRRLRALAVLGICGLALFVAVVALLPLFRPEYSSQRDPISALLIGRYGYVQTAAFFAAGLGSLVVAVGVRRATRGLGGSRLGSSMIGLWAIGFALAGIFPTDAEGQPSDTAKAFHAVVAMVAFVCSVAGMLVLSKVFERDARWRSFYPLSLGLGFAALVGFVDMFAVMVSMTDGFRGFGVIQRIYIGTVILWMVLTAIRLSSIAKSGHTTAPSR